MEQSLMLTAPEGLEKAKFVPVESVKTSMEPPFGTLNMTGTSLSRFFPMICQALWLSIAFDDMMVRYLGYFVARFAFAHPPCLGSMMLDQDLVDQSAATRSVYPSGEQRSEVKGRKDLPQVDFPRLIITTLISPPARTIANPTIRYGVKS